MRTNPLTLALTLVALPAAGTACTDESADAPRALEVTGTVSTATGPVPGGLVTLTVWSTDSALRARAAALQAISDSLGHYALRLDSLPQAPIDSLAIRLLPPGCTLARRDTLLRADLLPAEGGLSVPLLLPATRPPAYTQPGQVCAYGVHPIWGPGSYRFALRIDSVVADSFWGRWDLKYRFGSSDDEGTFRARATATALQLELTQQPVWNACLGLDLTVPLTAGGAWGPATVAPGQACLPGPLTFQFVADTPFALLQAAHR